MSAIENRLLTALVVVLAVVGCQTTPPPPPTLASVTLTAADDVNPNSEGRPSPVRVRVLELTSREAFDTADFFQLQESEAAVLGSALVEGQDVVLAPGETNAFDKELAPDTKFIGVFAAYQAIETVNWRTAGSVRDGKINRLWVDLGASGLTSREAVSEHKTSN